MSQIDALCYVMLPRRDPPTSRIRFLLVCEYRSYLIPALFMLASVTGWCASVWLLVYQHQRRSEAIAEGVLPFICSFLLAPVVGLVSYLVTRAPFFPLASEVDHLESVAVLPLLGGLFMRTFFDRLPELLSRIFDVLSGRRTGDGRNANSGVVLLVIACTCMSTAAWAQLPYFRCSNPLDICIAFTEGEKAACPDCQAWVKVFLNVSDVMRTAQAAQLRASGIATKGVASNFFLEAASKELYRLDIAESSGGLPRTRQIHSEPEKYGFRELREGESRVGSIAIIGNIAGIVVDRSGALRIAYPSAKTGEVNLETPSALATAEDANVKYLTPMAPSER